MSGQLRLLCDDTERAAAIRANAELVRLVDELWLEVHKLRCGCDEPASRDCQRPRPVLAGRALSAIVEA